MTRITFDRSGGAIGYDMHFDLDLESLFELDAENLLRLIDEADFYSLPETVVVHHKPDEFQYRITVEAEDKVHTVRVSDSNMEKSLLPLIKELTLLKMLQQ